MVLPEPLRDVAFELEAQGFKHHQTRLGHFGSLRGRLADLANCQRCIGAEEFVELGGCRDELDGVEPCVEVPRVL